MAWFKEVCSDLVCGCVLGIMDGIFGVPLFTGPEVKEITAFNKLAASIIEKSGEIGGTDAAICQGIRNGQMSALETFSKNPPQEVVQAGAVVAAEVICSKAFKSRFRTVLIGACLNLVGCEPL